MKKNLILIYDDDPAQRKKYKEMMEGIDALREFDIRPLEDKEFGKITEELSARRKALSEGTKREENLVDADVAKIFVVDFRLLDFLNGEEVAYNLLCFSDCGYIIGLNHYNMDRVFDLTMSGHLDSNVDLNLSYRDLENQGLWTGELIGGYRPWYWPSILSYLKNREKQIMDVEKNSNNKICEVLQIPELIIRSIPIRAAAYLATRSDDLSKMTFENFFRQSEIVLSPRERKIDFSEKRKAKIIASRLSKWLERAVLPAQDILVDAPHLVLRYPSLLKGDKSKIVTWNNTVKFKSPSDLGLNYNKIKTCLFNQHWISRPAWFWPSVTEIAEIEEVKGPWKRKEFDFVFAEDASAFYEKDKCRIFISNVDSSFRLRYIKDFRKDDVEYKPVNLLFKR